MRTPTSRTGESGRAVASAGFTVIELLAVLVLLSLAVGAVAVKLGDRGSKSIRTIAEQAAVKFRDARISAMEVGEEETVLIDVTHHRIASPHDRDPLVVDEKTRLAITAAASERVSGGTVAIRFFPNGQSTGGTLTLERNGEAHEVRINWFTGRITVGPRQ